MAPDKQHDVVWKHLLERKGLAAAASVLEEYGLPCEAVVSRLDKEDLGALTTVFLATRCVTITRNLILVPDDTVSLTLYGDWDSSTESD